MPTKKTVKKAAAKKAEPAAPKAKQLKVIKNPISYTVSNTFKLPMSKVWDAATKAEHLKGYFVDDMRGEFSSKLKPVGWFWKEWGWTDVTPVKYVRNKEMVIENADMLQNKYLITTRYECVRKGNQTILRIHESGYSPKDLKSAFMMAEGWAEFLCYLKAHLMGVDLRKAG